MYTEAHQTAESPEAAAGGRTFPRRPNARAPWAPAAGRAYERFLGLPVACVLATLWAAGALLLGSGASALFLAAWVLAR